MRAVLGIGNIGLRYQRNRHNAGFLILNYFAQNRSIKFRAAKGDYYICEGDLNQAHYFLIKPSNYVNNSGVAALQFLEKHNIDNTICIKLQLMNRRKNLATSWYC